MNRVKCKGKRFFAPTITAIIALAIALTVSCSEKCGDKKYDPETQFCYNDSEVKDKCDSKEYNPETQFCYNNDVVNKCGNNEYDLATKFCYNNSDVVDKCGDSEYNPETQFCDSRDSAIYKYVKINAQTWMAENLNFNAEGSKCYDNKEANCEEYGRLYNKKMAKTSCPSGWHLPSKKEWKALSSVSERDIKAKSGWEDHVDIGGGGKKSGNGTDKYGFAALPGGGYGDCEHYEGKSFSLAGAGGLWNSSTEGYYHYILNGASSYYIFTSYFNWTLLSVRCVKD